MMVFEVRFSRAAEKDLRKLPRPIVQVLNMWVRAVREEGLEEVRKCSGYHDEPLKGDRKGQRSIRLTRAYRAIYEIRNDAIEFVLIMEVNKHEY